MPSTTVHQCPFCEIRCLHASELKEHIVLDHREHVAEFTLIEPTERRGGAS
jgi:hypothetical protein